MFVYVVRLELEGREDWKEETRCSSFKSRIATEDSFTGVDAGCAEATPVSPAIQQQVLLSSAIELAFLVLLNFLVSRSFGEVCLLVAAE